MQPGRGRATAFVVIELVFVITILAILAALLFPLFARSLEQARSVPCIGNCAQLGMALHLYMHDYDGTFPTMYREEARREGDDWGEGYGGHWALRTAARRDYARRASIGAQLLPYTIDWTSWTCPLDTGVGRNLAIGTRWSSYHYRYFLYCGMSEGLKDTPGVGGRVWRDPEIEYPSQTYVFSELWPWHDDLRENLRWLPESDSQGWSPDAPVRLTFMDGHSRATRADRCILRAPWWRGQGYDYHWPRLPSVKDCGKG